MTPDDKNFPAEDQNDDIPAEDANLGTRLLDDLFSRHGVPKHKQASLITKILGLSRSHGARKRDGTYPLTLIELARIARHFGESLRQALEPTVTGAGLQDALLVTGELELPCCVELGAVVRRPQMQPHAAHRLVAIGAAERLLVVRAADVNLPARRVKRLVLRDTDTGDLEPQC